MACGQLSPSTVIVFGYLKLKVRYNLKLNLTKKLLYARIRIKFTIKIDCNFFQNEAFFKNKFISFFFTRGTRGT